MPLRRAGLVGIVLIVVGVVLLFAAVWSPWTDFSSAPSLAATGKQLTYNIPSLIAGAVTLGLLVARRTRPAAAVLAFVLSGWLLIGLTSTWLQALAAHTGTLGWGPVLSLVAVVALITGGVLLARAIGAGWRPDRTSILWTVPCLLLAALWVLGEWLPWVRTTASVTKPGVTFAGNGGTTVVRECCTAYSGNP